MRLPRARMAALAAVALAAAAIVAALTPRSGATVVGIHKIRHVIVIMQENRSFDNLFGTFPGADGIPPNVCLRDPVTHRCVAPFHSHTSDHDLPHLHWDALASIDHGRMDGFVRDTRTWTMYRHGRLPEVMGYHTDQELPTYWTYARRYVLQDRMFEPSTSWSLDAHLYLVSGWSARCRHARRPRSCHGSQNEDYPFRRHVHFAWTDLTWLLHRHHVSWRFYVAPGTAADCPRDPADCPSKRTRGTYAWWNPLPAFDTVRADHQLSHVQSVTHFYSAARHGRLPTVSWVVPSKPVSDHAPSSLHAGQAYVTGLVNAVMRGPDWSSTAIFVAWDDWGGFYDHVPPPRIGGNAYGIRVPGLLISPYARGGTIDHQTLSFDAYNKFIEDDFLGGARLDPRTDGRPDPRPSVRERSRGLGDLAREFDFSKAPDPPLLLPGGKQLH